LVRGEREVSERDLHGLISPIRQVSTFKTREAGWQHVKNESRRGYRIIDDSSELGCKALSATAWGKMERKKRSWQWERGLAGRRVTSYQLDLLLFFPLTRARRCAVVMYVMVVSGSWGDGVMAFDDDGGGGVGGEEKQALLIQPAYRIERRVAWWWIENCLPVRTKSKL